MKGILGILAIAGLLIAVDAASCGWTTQGAQAQSSCVTNCRSNGWGESQCMKYCDSRPEGSR